VSDDEGARLRRGRDAHGGQRRARHRLGAGGADGGRRAAGKELRLLAGFLRGRTVPDRSLDALREHVRSTGLDDHLDPDELRGRAEKVRRLSDIARDL